MINTYDNHREGKYEKLFYSATRQVNQVKQLTTTDGQIPLLIINNLEHLRVKKMIKEIIIHCSDTPEGRETSAADIHRWHREQGWDGIGYHYVVVIDGSVENGRPEYWTGAHAKGHNKDSISVCVVGRGNFNDAQWSGLECLIDALMQVHPEAKVIGHNEVSDKTCPNFDVQYWLKARGLI